MAEFDHERAWKCKQQFMYQLGNMVMKYIEDAERNDGISFWDPKMWTDPDLRGDEYNGFVRDFGHYIHDELGALTDAQRKCSG